MIHIVVKRGMLAMRPRMTKQPWRQTEIGSGYGPADVEQIQRMENEGCCVPASLGDPPKANKSREDAEIHGIYQDIQERKTYANRIYILISAWLIASHVIVMLQGF